MHEPADLGMAHLRVVRPSDDPVANVEFYRDGLGFEVLYGTPGAAEIDRQVQSIAGSSQLAQEIYGIAAAVFADLARSSGGDAARMSDTLERAKSDPAGFAARLSPDTLRRLRELSTKISDAKH